MSVLTFVVPFFLVMTVVVLVHELGHFLVARWCGVTVHVFSLGFGREVVGRTDKYGTRWRLGWIPLGGYLKLFDSDQRSQDAAARPPAAQMRQEPFRAKPVWQRSAILVAGPLANLLLAVVIYATLNMAVGETIFQARIGTVIPGSPASSAGLRSGDVVTSIDGAEVNTQDGVIQRVGASGGQRLSIEIERGGDRLIVPVIPTVEQHQIDAGTIRWGDIGIRRPEPATVGTVIADLPAEKAGIEPGDRVIAIGSTAITSYDDLVQVVAAHPLQALHFTIVRNGSTQEITVTPALFRQDDGHGNVTLRGRIGISCAEIQLALIPAVVVAFREAAANTGDILAGLWVAVTGAGGKTSEVGGPIAMAQVTGEVAELGIVPLIRLTAVLSISIGLLNLLPVPVLDGGRLVFCTIEALRRKPVALHIEQSAYRIGLALVLVVLIYVNVTDLMGVGLAWLSRAG